MMENKAHGIKDFLARPIQMGNGDVTAALAAGFQLQTIQLPGDYLSHATVKEKVRGFKFFKGTAVVTIVINGTRFQQGRLLTTFFPQADVAPFKYAEVKRNLIYLTQLPRVEMDINTDDHVTMEIPWVNTELAYDTETGVGSHGRVDTYIYSPLVVPTGNSDCEYTIYVSYKDVMLTMPNVPQGLIAQGAREVSRGKKKDPPTQESENNRPLSTALMHVSKLAGIASGVPLLSSIAGPTSWFTSMLSDTAHFWGFCKPIIVEKPIRVIQRPMIGASNTSGYDTGVQLGCIEDNSVSILPGAMGTDEDEMTFAGIVSRYAFFNTTAITDTMNVGTLITNIPLGPAFFSVGDGSLTINGTARATLAPLPCAYVATSFYYYRGGFKFRFKFVKTEFHSGRIQFAFYPDVTNATTISLNQQNYLYREIVDLRITNEVELAVPYVSASPYQQPGTAYGYLLVTVVNELRAPTGASSTIQMLTEVAMTSDSEFAAPCTSILTPVLSYATPPAISASSTNWTPQGASETNQDVKVASSQLSTELNDKIEVPAIATATVDNLNTANSAEYCIGEVVASFRQLLKRHYPFFYAGGSIASNTTNTLQPRNFLYAYPGITNVTTPQIPDLMMFVAPLYLYNRGSMRVKAYPMVAGTSTDCLRAELLPYALVGFNSTALTNSLDQSTFQGSPAIFPQNTNNTFEVTLPFYHRTHSAINQVVPFSVGGVAGYSPVHTIRIRSQGNTNVNNFVYTRAAGDDFSFGFYLSTPRVLVNTSGFEGTAATNTTFW